MTRHLKTLMTSTLIAFGLAACNYGESSVDKTAASPVESLSKAELAAVVEEAAQKGSEVNASYNVFLAKYVTQKNGINLVAYEDVSEADERALEAYIQTLSNTDISTYSAAEQQAYWYNLYNAQTVDLILNNMPLESIRQISRPWDQKLLTVNGRKMSLNDVEHETLRKQFDEPRVHFAVNCASIGCPNLKMTAWEADTLDADLTKASQDYVRSPRGITIDAEGKVDASEIFKWYRDDFGSNEKEMLSYLAQFAEGPTKSTLESASKVDDWDYDWSLNIAK